MKKNPRMDELVRVIGELAKTSSQLAHQAVQQYGSEVEAILRDQSLDHRRIEHTLDGMLDFCFDPSMLILYKKLCRYYFKIDPEATASYVYFYREMWDEKEEERVRERRGSGNKIRKRKGALP